MPIKPENRSRYPANWKAIRAEILERSRNTCEQCRVPNGITILRGMGRDKNTYQLPDGVVRDAVTGHLCRLRDAAYLGSPTRVVLTIAHLDHTPEHCDPSNLRALCQRCHLAYDAEHHAETARRTRRARKAIGDLFEA